LRVKGSFAVIWNMPIRILACVMKPTCSIITLNRLLQLKPIQRSTTDAATVAKMTIATTVMLVDADVEHLMHNVPSLTKPSFALQTEHKAPPYPRSLSETEISFVPKQPSIGIFYRYSGRTERTPTESDASALEVFAVVPIAYSGFSLAIPSAQRHGTRTVGEISSTLLDQ
jgi:hypothetical protein